MRNLLICLTAVLALGVAAAAQTTYPIVGGPYADGYNPPYLYSFSIQLAGTNNSISWVTGSENHEWACGNGKPSQGGFINYTLNGVAQPCANSVTYTVSGTTTIDGCTGPAQAVETFDDGSTLTVYWTYTKNKYGHCRAEEIAGSLVTAN